jgi:hypothetical protein
LVRKLPRLASSRLIRKRPEDDDMTLLLEVVLLGIGLGRDNRWAVVALLPPPSAPGPILVVGLLLVLLLLLLVTWAGVGAVVFDTAAVEVDTEGCEADDDDDVVVVVVESTIDNVGGYMDEDGSEEKEEEQGEEEEERDIVRWSGSERNSA